MAASRLLAMQSVVGRDVIPFTVQEIWRAISRYAYAPISVSVSADFPDHRISGDLRTCEEPGGWTFLDHRACVCGASSSGYAPSEYGRAALLLRCGILCGSPARAGGEKYGGRSHEEPLHGGERGRSHNFRILLPPDDDSGRRCSLDLLLPDGCPDDMLGVCRGIRLQKSAPGCARVCSCMRSILSLYGL